MALNREWQLPFRIVQEGEVVAEGTVHGERNRPGGYITMGVHESRVSLETLLFCRELVEEQRADAQEEKEGTIFKDHKAQWQATEDVYTARLAELDAEIAAKIAPKEAEGEC